jgi:hypothetical protein
VAAWRKNRDSFFSELGDTQLLLVQIPELDSELPQGLHGASTVSGVRLKPTYDGIGFATVLHSASDDARPSWRPLGRSFDPTTLETLCVRNTYFVVPLRRRETGRAFVEHISVGRARNSDIVLRHESVSKFHAWFECDESGKFYLGDAKSKNGTRVNGVSVVGGDLCPLDSGDELRFGRITTLICPPATFWEAIRA